MPAFVAQRIEGTVVNEHGQPVGFAAVAIQKKNKMAVCNEDGKFEMNLAAGEASDTLTIIAFGYRRTLVPLKAAGNLVNITLRSDAVTLEEVEIRPQPPEFYIKEAMRQFRQNSPASPFCTIAYYHEKLKENNHFVKYDEAVFRTYHPASSDTAHNQDQVLLHRQDEKVQDLAFMRRTREKKARSKDSKKDTAKTEAGFHFGGPEIILRTARFNNRSWSFLDTTKFRDFRYNFEPSTTYDHRPQIVIAFSSKGKVDNMRSEGRIFIDAASFAITRVEDKGNFVIPFYIKSFLFVYGLQFQDARFTRNVELRLVNSKWYPQNIRYRVDLEASKRYWFSPDDHSAFAIEQVIAVNRLELTDPKAISAEKRFDPKKEMKIQVHNDLDLHWKDVNVIRM
jgi:hypothetical protein